MTDFAVQVQNLSKHFGSFHAVDGISFEVERGEIFGFLGPNGAGKSTTIRMLCGLLSPTSGSGQVAGLDIVTQSEAIKTRIGYMSQKFSLYDDLSVEENIQFYAGIYGVSARKYAERKKWILHMAGLEGREQSLTGDLSMGWKQRLALGTAIVHEPEILFLDEPTSGVDPVSRRQFWELIHEVAAGGVTVFVTTHFMDEAEHCQRLALIYKGKMVALGTPRELKLDFAGNSLADISVKPILKALELLIDHKLVIDAALFGTDLHVVVAEQAHGEALMQMLADNGCEVSHLEWITPSLEDVFVGLIEREDRMGASV
ncbi:MAG: ABC transporter ATP-binding protein [Armatimonadota bacterium]